MFRVREQNQRSENEIMKSLSRVIMASRQRWWEPECLFNPSITPSKTSCGEFRGKTNNTVAQAEFHEP